MIIVSLVGPKRCGKTAVAEALIREFGRRDFKATAGNRSRQR
jgi:molybdopterin-guanine dinucleotide biosynthesis protein